MPVLTYFLTVLTLFGFTNKNVFPYLGFSLYPSVPENQYILAHLLSVDCGPSNRCNHWSHDTLYCAGKEMG